MTLLEYQQQANSLDRHLCDDRLWYPCLGLAGEIGELIEPITKFLRGDPTPLDKDYLTLEMEDILWYLTTLATRLGISLEDVAKNNLIKLTERKIHGKQTTSSSI